MVYLHYRKVGNITEPFYVGRASRKDRCYSRDSRTNAWHDAVADSGGKFGVIIVESGLTLSDSIEKERVYIQRLASKYLVNVKDRSKARKSL